jgi:hypothetical protein
MKMHSFHSSKQFLLLILLSFHTCNARSIFTFKMHHRFSEPVKNWSQSSGMLSPAHHWPKKGTVEYYAELAYRDRLLHGRKLSDSEGTLAFSDGNSTFRINSLGLYVFLSCLPSLYNSISKLV